MKPCLPCVLLFSWLMMGVAAPLSATTYYVSPSGSDLNTGQSPAQAWKTLARPNALNFDPGDTLLLEGSQTFQGTLYLSEEDAGTTLNPIVISSYGTGRATLMSGQEHGVLIYNTAGIVVSQLRLSGSPTAIKGGVFAYQDKPDLGPFSFLRFHDLEISQYTAGILVGGDNSQQGFADGEIFNCYVHDCLESGIILISAAPVTGDGYSHADWHIHHNLVENITGFPNPTNHSGNGILVSNVDRCLIEFNEARFCGSANIHCGGPVGIWAFYGNEVIIQYNESHHNSNGQGCDGGGFDLDGGCTNSIMQYNYSHDNDGAGFLVAQYADALPMENIAVRYNISENDGKENGYGGITLWGSGIGEDHIIRHVYVHNNTIYTAASSSATAVSVWSDSFDHIEFFNNLFLTESNPVLDLDASDLCSFRRNLYHSYAGNFQIKVGNQTFYSLAEWAQNTGAEYANGNLSGYQGDPNLTAYGTLGTVSDFSQLFADTTYHLTALSPSLNKGIMPTYEMLPGAFTDFFSQPFLTGAAPDQGAHEYPVNVKRTTSLEPQLDAPDIRLWPVPASSILHLEVPDKQQLMTWQVFSPEGALIVETSPVSSPYPLDIRSFPNGLYLLLGRNQQGISLPARLFEVRH